MWPLITFQPICNAASFQHPALAIVLVSPPSSLASLLIVERPPGLNTVSFHPFEFSLLPTPQPTLFLPKLHKISAFGMSQGLCAVGEGEI